MVKKKSRKKSHKKSAVAKGRKRVNGRFVSSKKHPGVKAAKKRGKRKVKRMHPAVKKALKAKRGHKRSRTTPKLSGATLASYRRDKKALLHSYYAMAKLVVAVQ